jgi:hypothetical protein
MLFNNQVETTVKIITKILILHGLSYFLCDTLCKNFIISRRFTQIREQIDANILRAPWKKTFFAFAVKNNLKTCGMDAPPSRKHIHPG